MNHLPLYIAAKYLRSKRRGYLSFVSGVALLGITLGVSLLILVSSVMNGFEKELKDRVLQSIPHASITGNISIQEMQRLRDELTKNTKVLGSSPFIETQGLISSNSSLKGIYLYGIYPEIEKEVSIIKQRVIYGNFNNLDNISFGLVIGDILAAQLDVGLDDFVNLIVPDTTSGLVGTFPRTKRFQVVGIFSTGSTEIDQSHVYVHIENAAKLLRMKNSIHGVRVKYTDLFESREQISRDTERINLDMGRSYSFRDWTYSYGTLFKAIKMEKFLVALLLSSIILVAIFNVVATLLLTINEKQSQIAIIMTVGGTKAFVQKIFLFYGTFIGLAGTFIGLILGIILSIFLSPIVELLEYLMNTSFLEVYFINYFPIDIRFNWILIICILSVTLSLVASYFPAKIASNIEPAEVLRHE